MADTPKLLDVVALLEDVPDYGLRRGQVGTVVEEWAPGVFEVEFSDDSGRTYALLALHSDQLILRHYESTLAAGRAARCMPTPPPPHLDAATLITDGHHVPRWDWARVFGPSSVLSSANAAGVWTADDTTVFDRVGRIVQQSMAELGEEPTV
ncbi:DUF4926 domain-containing protein [Candidatus Gracilibacteria bacterium]|nr:DUF4926 domain-containing protein [Candidatus Gracilibacteria bacterium]